MNESLDNLITMITTSDRAGIKHASKELDIALRNRDRRDAHSLTLLRPFLDALDQFDTFPRVENQAAFISALKWPFLIIEEEEFERFAPFILHVMQHPSGTVRQAVVRVIDWLLIGISFSMPVLEKITPEQAKRSEQNRERFCTFAFAVEHLLNVYSEPRFRRYKYISRMPPSVYKSLQQLFVEHILRSDRYTETYEKWKRDKGLEGQKNAIIKTDVYFPQITLKYAKTVPTDQSKPETGLTCTDCGKHDIIPCSTRVLPSGDCRPVCEACAVKGYQKTYGFTDQTLAAARRRRMFDVLYLFQEIVIDAYVARRMIAVDSLDEQTYLRLIQIAGDAYNTLFTREEKIALEETVAQPDIARVLEQKAQQILLPKDL